MTICRECGGSGMTYVDRRIKIQCQHCTGTRLEPEYCDRCGDRLDVYDEEYLPCRCERED